MDLDLDRMLTAVRDGQWSVDELDWSAPIAGIEKLDRKQRREAGRALLFTARLEVQGARSFELTAERIDDPVAKQIYRWFGADERRHAAAEIKLAARYGVPEDDLPRPLDWALRSLEANFDPPTTGVYELSSASIILFELALDTVLIPALKDLADDPLQAEVFRRIDRDESRHLAMDYWLLDRKGEQHRGRDARDILTDGARESWLDRARGTFALSKTLAALFVAFGTATVAMPTLRRMERARWDRYLARVAAVPKKAPHALELATYRMGLRGQQRILDLMARLS
jgi:hypothetical protein